MTTSGIEAAFFGLVAQCLYKKSVLVTAVTVKITSSAM
jgi:hypothetical protein